MKRIRVAAAVIRQGEKIFAAQRGYGAAKDGWEFPGGKIDPGETPEEALIREIREELDTEIRVDEKLTTVEHEEPGFCLTMECFLCTVVSGRLTLKEHENAKWLGPEEMDAVDWLPADRTAVAALKDRMGKIR